MSKQLKVIISILVIIGAAVVAYLVLQSNRGEDKKEEKYEEIEETTFLYTDPQAKFTLSLPKAWQDYYEVENKKEEEMPLTIFNYPAEDETQALLLIIKAYPASTNLFAITSTPNTEIIAQTMETIFTMSQPLDMPFEQGTTDFERYAQMVDQIDEVAKSINPDSQIYTLSQAIYEQDSEGRRYIDVVYPEIKGEKSFSAVNQIIKQEMEEFISEFKKNLEEWGDVYMPEGAYSAFLINYQPKLLDNDLVSIYFTISENMAGAAHPNNYNHALNFDLETNQKIGLKDLFKVEQEQYLARLSELVLADLKAQFTERSMDPEGPTLISGTEPKEENFDNFNVTKEGIVFNFGSYQVAAHAAGEFFSLIPFSQLENILQEKFVR